MASDPRYYIGKVSSVEDRVFYKIRVDVEGIVEGAMAFPMKGEVDEPLIGDKVLLYNVDPEFGSMYLYSRIKEDAFLGFRSNGKIMSLISSYSNDNGSEDADNITIGIYDISEDGNDDEVGQYITSIIINRKDDDKKGSIDVTIGNDKYKGGPKANLNMKVMGNVDVNVSGDEGSTINITNNSKVTIGGNADIEVKGNTNVNSQGKCTINSPSGINIESSSIVEVTGGGTLKVSGTAGANSTGPFCAIPFCVFSGAPHGSQTVVGI